MTMADRNVKGLSDDGKNAPVDDVDPSSVPHLRFSVSRTSSRGAFDRDRRASNLDLNNSPSLRPGSAARDSGYNTDVSPAATISPATNTTRQQHFVFDNITHSHISDLEDRASSISHISTNLTAGSIPVLPHTPCSYPPYQLHFEHRSRCTPPLRLSPDIFKVCASPDRIAYQRTHTSSRPVSESSDTNRIQFDFESDNEEDSTNRRENGATTIRTSVPSKISGEHFELSESFMGFPLSMLSHDSDDGDDEDAFHKSDDALRNWGIVSEPHTPRSSSSLSLRQRRYCSTDDDDNPIGACGGHHPDDDSLFFSGNQTLDQRRHSFNDSSREHQIDRRSNVRKVESGCEIQRQLKPDSKIPCTHRESSLFSSQDFQPSNVDTCRSRDSDSENHFTFDPDDIDGDDDINAHQSCTRDSRSKVIVQDRMSHHSVIHTRLRSFNGTAYLRLSSGCLLPWARSIDRVSRMSVSTQTPHMTSIMIQQILDTPAPLPNETRGTAAGLLRRRQSEGRLPLPPGGGSRQLPDIIPSGRDRSMSVPDLQTLARMQRAREVGRELRRLSDEFHFGIFPLIPISEEVDGHSSRWTARLISNQVTRFWTFVRYRFHRTRRRPVSYRRSTPVDVTGRAELMSLTEHAEDLPGD